MNYSNTVCSFLSSPWLSFIYKLKYQNPFHCSFWQLCLTSAPGSGMFITAALDNKTQSTLRSSHFSLHLVSSLQWDIEPTCTQISRYPHLPGHIISSSAAQWCFSCSSPGRIGIHSSGVFLFERDRIVRDIVTYNSVKQQCY